ncbi:MAG: MotA/TolQ/ExbB proton channel family protein [Allosphingosinicella sp.]
MSALTAPGGDRRRALAALRPLLRARPEEDGQTADNAIRQIQRILDFKSIDCIDRVKTPIEFVREAARRLADAEDSREFHEWAESELEERRVRHDGAISVWRSAADVAPAMGMIGTVLGLMSLFASMSNPEAMGAGMAATMLSTLYGLIIAFGVAGPVAARLERLSDAERRWQRRVLERLEALARVEEEAMKRWVGRRGRVAK